MEKETIAVSERELQRWRLIELVEAGKITLKEAAEKMGVVYRQAKNSSSQTLKPALPPLDCF